MCSEGSVLSLDPRDTGAAVFYGLAVMNTMDDPWDGLKCSVTRITLQIWNGDLKCWRFVGCNNVKIYFGKRYF